MSSNSEWPQATPGAPENAMLPESSATPLNAPEALSENPTWSGWDVVKIFVMAIVLLIGCLLGVALATKLIAFPHTKFMVVMAFPLVNFVAQMLGYLALLAYMMRVATRREGTEFWSSIRWNWPLHGIGGLVLTGIVSFVALFAIAHLLPMPKKSPFEQFFTRPLDAYAIAVLAVSIGPLMEELAFRGFLYPILARRLNVRTAILFTALPFALIHYPEYGSWSPVLIVFLVGLVLTVVRAWRQSVAAGFIVHAAYNGVQMAVVFVATGGFRHLEKMTQ